MLLTFGAASHAQNSGAPVWTQVMNSGESVAYYVFDNSTPYSSQDTGSTTSPRPAGHTYGNKSATPWHQARNGCLVLDNNPSGIHWGGTSSGYPNYTITNSMNNTYPIPAPGEYSVSPLYTGMKGLEALVRFDGSVANPDTQNGSTRITETVYFSDRVCFDAGNEYGFFRWIGMGDASYRNSLSPPDKFADGYYFYYSVRTNCGTGYQDQRYFCTASTLPATALSAPFVGHRIDGLTDGALYYFHAYIPSNGSSTAFRLEVLDGSAGTISCTIDGVYKSTCNADFDTTNDVDYFTGGHTNDSSFWPGWSMSNIDTGYVMVGTQTLYDYDPTYHTVSASPSGSGAQLEVSAIKVGK